MFCFNMYMVFEILSRKPIQFYEKNGIKFFENFKAVDKYKKPVTVSIDSQSYFPTIFARNHNDVDSFYELEMDISKRRMKGRSMAADPQKSGIGEIMKLASIMEFQANRFNNFDLFALQEAIQFYTRYGFKLVTDNVDEILHNLNIVKKSKSYRLSTLRDKADFFYPRIKGKIPSDDPHLLQRGCDVVSECLKDMSRNGERINYRDLKYNSNMRYTDWETVINRDYLNSLMDLHEINYKI